MRYKSNIVGKGIFQSTCNAETACEGSIFYQESLVDLSHAYDSAVR